MCLLTWLMASMVPSLPLHKQVYAKIKRIQVTEYIISIYQRRTLFLTLQSCSYNIYSTNLCWPTEMLLFLMACIQQGV